MSLPPIQDTHTDCERLALIAHLAKTVCAHSGRAVAAMTGGSALRLCHGLTRPWWPACVTLQPTLPDLGKRECLTAG